ncbi:MAG: DUF6088 family protein [Bacteroidota bacterium]
MVSVDNKVLKRIRGKGRGSVFKPSDFLDLGSRAAVDQALSRLTRSGTIRRIGRGIYDFPKRHPMFGDLTAPVDVILNAVNPGGAGHLQPSGASAANMLGLSTQVPARIVYLTDGPSRVIRIGKRRIHLQHIAHRYFEIKGRSALVVQALRYLGKKNIDSAVINTLQNSLSAKDKQQLGRDMRHAPAWIAKVLQPIMQDSRKQKPISSGDAV